MAAIRLRSRGRRRRRCALARRARLPLRRAERRRSAGCSRLRSAAWRRRSSATLSDGGRRRGAPAVSRAQWWPPSRTRPSFASVGLLRHPRPRRSDVTARAVCGPRGRPNADRRRSRKAARRTPPPRRAVGSAANTTTGDRRATRSVPFLLLRHLRPDASDVDRAAAAATVRPTGQPRTSPWCDRTSTGSKPMATASRRTVSSGTSSPFADAKWVCQASSSSWPS